MNTRTREINTELKALSDWKDQLKYAVLQSNRMIYEELSGMETSITDVITCAEILYLSNPKRSIRFTKAIKNMNIYN
ncbi:hypothetical protein [Diaphorobacter aerolatus]|uniref:Uncharacterized protein n=1 Tax=Diaphorobacter aerolatus TaxID=1288495 RepID=A0A7H0GJC8_9BURK|nr:hypothetical protein [Diaphorobacter aerolatus]QNP48394.1 hypothetical protein H9K75_20965 [Diaphorobacter aerolatus]